MIEEYIGIIGAVVLLIAFALLELDKLSRDKISFHILNFIGASLLLVYAFIINSYVFVALNVAWDLFSLYRIIKCLQ